MSQPPESKPTYKDLWTRKGATILDVWQGGTKLDANNLSIIWNHYPIWREVAELAVQEYNERFHTQYTLEQVDIPIRESLPQD